MAINWEIFTIIGILIAAISLWLTFRKSRPDEEKEALVTTFYANQKLSQSNIESLRKLATDANGWHNEFSKGLTYKAAYELMIENHETHLSEGILQSVLKEKNLTKSIIASMQKSLEIQQANLQQLEIGIIAARKSWEGK